MMTCRVCETPGRMTRTRLSTCEDQLSLGEYRVLVCPNCRNGITHPLIPPADYELPVDESISKLSAGQQTLMEYFLNRRIEKIRALAPSGRLLDAGAGACAFANGASRAGYEVTAIEPNEKNGKFASEKVRFVSQPFDFPLLDKGVLEPESFDVITMWHSLEHTPHPGLALSLAKRLLKPGGVLFVNVPNFGGLQAKFGGNYWTFLDVPHHLTHFTSRGLSNLAEKQGLVPRKQFWLSLEYDVFGWFQTILNVVSRSHNYFYNKTKKKRSDESYLRHPSWTRSMTRLSPLFLPLAGLMTLLSSLVRSPSCLEIGYRK
jgi:SAM-dependent methyltransferase